MPTTFEYIEDTLVKAFDVQPEPTAEDREDAQVHSRALICGFRVRNEAAERAFLDRRVAQKRNKVQAFLENRTEAKKWLAGRGVTPLAILPKAMWADLTRQAGLFTLQPSTAGKVAFAGAKLREKFQGQKGIDTLAKKDWPGFLKTMWPDMSGSYGGNTSWTWQATVVLPDPPAEVASILLKMNGCALKVAAVAEAISFVETPEQLVYMAKAHPKDAWAQAQGYADYTDWVKRDPIVFYENEHAAVIVAQFGEFPIEQDLVDRIAGLSASISDNVEVETMKAAVEVPRYVSVSEALESQHNREARQRWLEVQRAIYASEEKENDYIKKYHASTKFGKLFGA